MQKKISCNYPNCEECNIEFKIPICMLQDAEINTKEAIIIEPKEGFVLIRNDNE